MSVQVSYESLGRDGLAEIADRALNEVVSNLGDPNTDPKKARKLVMEVTLTPKAEERGQSVKVSYVCKTTMAPVKPVVLTAALNIAPDGSGTMTMNEIGENPFQAELPIEGLVTETGGKVVAMNGGNRG